MRILQIFNRYSSVGGEEIAVEQISAELAEHHEFRAITFDSNAWASESGALSRLRQFLAMAYHPASIREVRRQIEDFRPEVILLHNLMPVGSAGLYWYLSRCGVPLVHYIHNFRPFSVNGYCWGRGQLLPQGVRKNFLPEILAGSWQGSRLKTAWYALLLWGLHACGVFRRMDGWIAISRFMKRTFVEGGVAGERIKVISHSWEPQCGDAEVKALAAMEPVEPVFLFLGRLTEEKGLRVLLDAWAQHVDSTLAGRLVIAGEGPLREEVEVRCAQLRGASCVGFQSGENKKRLLRECTALVVPSVWWEPLGLVLYEAYDFGKPVLAARSGGILDHVQDGVTGWLHAPGDVAELAAHILAACSERATCHTRGANGRKLLLERSSNVWIDDFNGFVGGIVLQQQSRKPR